MKTYPHWGSHLPILIKIVQMTKGPILELGVGIVSTPVLHWMCHEANRELVSYELHEGYFDMFKRFQNNYHKMHLPKNWDEAKIERPWDVALIDHNDDRRATEVKRLANHAKYLIVHDTEDSADHHYGYSKIFPMFKYRHDYPKVPTRTTVLSNFVDLSNL